MLPGLLWVLSDICFHLHFTFCMKTSCTGLFFAIWRDMPRKCTHDLITWQCTHLILWQSLCTHLITWQCTHLITCQCTHQIAFVSLFKQHRSFIPLILWNFKESTLPFDFDVYNKYKRWSSSHPGWFIHQPRCIALRRRRAQVCVIVCKLDTNSQ